MSEFTAVSSLENDLAYMEVLDTPDKFSFVRGVMDSNELWDLEDTPPDEMRQFYMWEFADEHGGIIRQTAPDHVFRGEQKVFTRLGQGTIIEVDAGPDPYLRANLSECSVLVARGEQGLCAAHLSFSEERHMQAALQHFSERGFSPSDIQVVASLGSGQKAHNYFGASYGPKRLATVQDYLQWGILPEHITSFAFSVSPEKPTRNRGLCEVTIGQEGMLVTTFDATSEIRGGFMHEVIQPETVDEHFVPAIARP